jgi:hypothetical protein
MSCTDERSCGECAHCRADVRSGHVRTVKATCPPLTSALLSCLKYETNCLLSPAITLSSISARMGVAPTLGTAIGAKGRRGEGNGGADDGGSNGGAYHFPWNAERES